MLRCGFASKIAFLPYWFRQVGRRLAVRLSHGRALVLDEGWAPGCGAWETGRQGGGGRQVRTGFDGARPTISQRPVIPGCQAPRLPADHTRPHAPLVAHHPPRTRSSLALGLLSSLSPSLFTSPSDVAPPWCFCSSSSSSSSSSTPPVTTVSPHLQVPCWRRAVWFVDPAVRVVLLPRTRLPVSHRPEASINNPTQSPINTDSSTLSALLHTSFSTTSTTHSTVTLRSLDSRVSTAQAKMADADVDNGPTIERITKEGKKLTYQLTVIQQPERARACGSGAKSSADRRPVDPPPVVKLRIFEGIDTKTDITFSYDANFFLFATLELARPMAHGRVQPSVQQIPVLTGMPVSGMAYLDRPKEAGYFIFPDLSVRHEGKYRLSFNLYEDTKNAKDKDSDESTIVKNVETELRDCPNGSFDWRMEVKSNPFTVFSAKKFPGLTESTTLSRTVAEQGCRVRIRRDVRMRRRDGKGNGEGGDEYDEEYRRSPSVATPDSVPDVYSRPRSLSNSGVDRQHYIADTPRRASGADYPQQPYSSSYGPAPPPAHPSASREYPNLSFGQPSQPYPAPQFAQPQPPPHQPSQHQYQAPAYNHTPQYRQPSSGYPTFSERQPYGGPYASQRDNYDAEYRRGSATYQPPPPTQAPNQYTPTEQNYNRIAQGSAYPPRGRSPVHHAPVLAPLKMLEPKYDSPSSTTGGLLSATTRMAPTSALSPTYHDRPNVPTYTSSSEPTRNNKRPFESVFSSSSFTQPLHNGMRPSSAHHTQASAASFDEDDDCVSMEALKMQYKRADGSNHFRELPTLE